MKKPVKITEYSFTRRQALAGIGAGVSLSALGGCARTADQRLGAASSPSDMLDQIAYNLLAHEPERATGLGVDVGAYSPLRGKLEDQSQAGQDAFAATLKSDLAAIRAINTDSFDPATRTSFEVVESAYATALDGFALPYGDVAVGSWRNAPYVVIQNVGTYLDMGRFMDSSHPVETEEDVYAYLNRLSAMPSTLRGELERVKAARAMGVVPPDFLLDKAITQMELSIKNAREGGSLVSSLTSKIISKFGEDALGEKGEYAYSIVTGEIAPALEEQLAELKAQRAVATGDPGMAARPKGDEYYAWALRASTTTSMTPDEIHEKGLEELADLHGQMDPILQELGYSKGSVGARMTALGQDPRFKFAAGDPGRAEIMAFIEDRIAWIKSQMPRAFNTLVDPNLEVKRIPIAEELGAPGAYGGAGSKDGSIPGRMWINLRDTDLHRKYDLADLTYHETIPGHVWEGEYSNTLPLIRSILAFNAFSEGWALYGEQIADELGAYDEYKVGRLGYLQSLAFRACRMVVDTGLHHKRWSRQQGVDFFVQRNGSKPQEVASEVDRYCSWPGQACGYKVGHSEIVRQRARAQVALGRNYDFKAFNDAVVLGGNAPLDVMAKNVGRYIAGAA
ncbi:DUF885 domain-containing protein [Altererythrobacter sp. ZODW24]|uniref:DUF885 domain-containing protein n=1 Tax=Altererythrobacter sp. ZODW24 TaxID=2185142 RepID=UPI000DF8284D|nr:DUF885 domain-containing protein [Altererythrobacter sp. ZODW24]